ncbi:MAG TPA: outer membrane protein assembly factor BamA [Vicinamibacterales bacterium]|nr:outer membrane protein assembly factor BamA [Vicinamibacterales bacterium]
MRTKSFARLLVGLMALQGPAFAASAYAAPVEGAASAGQSPAQQPLPPVAPVPQPSQQPAPQQPALPPVAAPAQQPPAPAAALPPAGSPPLVRFVEIKSTKQNDALAIDPETYLYYIQTKPSSAQFGRWVPYDEAAVLEDFKRLWATNFLDDLTIEVKDVPYANGVIGKHIIFDLEERQRVKIVNYVGSNRVEQSKIEEKLREVNAQIRLDSFIDPGLVQRVRNVVQDLYAEKGYLHATVKPQITPLAGGPKLVNLTFTIEEGPKVKIRDVEFVGNKEVSDRALARRMKENKARGFLSFITGGGTYKEDKFEEDAEKVIEHYRDKGYIAARVGSPELKVLEDSRDGKSRWIQLSIPVTEGERYRVGTVSFEGQSVVKEEALRPLFKLRQGNYYSEKNVRKGLEKAREIFGSGGYMEFTGYPDLKPREGAQMNGDPVVDVTMRLQEGKQYFVNRIIFVGNTTTRDNVIRREMRLYEAGVFNTEALKFSIRRLNQLGYFKPLEGNEAIDVQKTPNEENQVDVTLKFEEQNRNQLTFGAGVSQFEGFFGQLSFQTANFLGRGETFTLSAQQGSRAKNYQIAFTEPFLFDRPITAGIDTYIREIRYIGLFTQASAGGNFVFGFPLRDFTRMFTTYSYERTQVKELYEGYNDPELQQRNPYLYDSLLLGQGGRRTISKVTPSVVHNTVDNPIFPTTGRRYTASIDLAGVGGDTYFYSPTIEGVWYLQQARRVSLGLRVQTQYVAPYGSTQELPIFEKLFLGGEYSVRGFDIRTIGPRDPLSGLVIGGNKSLLFNAEYLISVAGPVRLVLFYDAGQVQDRGQKFALDDFKTSTGAEVRFFMPVLNVPFRLIFAYNPQREGVLDNSFRPQQKFTFRFAVGSTF